MEGDLGERGVLVVGVMDCGGLCGDGGGSGRHGEGGELLDNGGLPRKKISTPRRTRSGSIAQLGNMSFDEILRHRSCS